MRLLLLWSHKSIVIAVALKFVSLRGLGGVVAVATITTAVAFRRTAYAQCVAHRAFLTPRCDALLVCVSGQLKPS